MNLATAGWLASVSPTRWFNKNHESNLNHANLIYMFLFLTCFSHDIGMVSLVLEFLELFPDSTLGRSCWLHQEGGCLLPDLGP